MSSWYGTARSNYVKIDDMAGLEAALKPFCVKITPQDTDPAAVYFTLVRWVDDDWLETELEA